MPPALLADEELHAPGLLDFEVASALRGHVLGVLSDEDRLERALDDLTASSVERHHMTAALGQILDLRDDFTAHDAPYVVLTRALGARMVICDAKVAKARQLGADIQIFGG